MVCVGVRRAGVRNAEAVGGGSSAVTQCLLPGLVSATCSWVSPESERDDLGFILLV